jgi:hypothetical protein
VTAKIRDAVVDRPVADGHPGRLRPADSPLLQPIHTPSPEPLRPRRQFQSSESKRSGQKDIVEALLRAGITTTAALLLVAVLLTLFW